MRQKTYQKFFVRLIRNKQLFALLLLGLLATLANGSVYAQGGETPSVDAVTHVTSFAIGRKPILVVPNLTLTGPIIEKVSVSIDSENFNAAEDQLGIKRQRGKSGTVESSIKWTYDTTTGILELSGSADAATYQAALRQVIYNNTNKTTESNERTVSITIGSSLFSDKTKHYYKYVNAPNITWTDAKTAAAAKENKYYGLQGYLVTVTSVEENNFIMGKLQGNGWMGPATMIKMENGNGSQGQSQMLERHFLGKKKVILQVA